MLNHRVNAKFGHKHDRRDHRNHKNKDAHPPDCFRAFMEGYIASPSLGKARRHETADPLPMQNQVQKDHQRKDHKGDRLDIAPLGDGGAPKHQTEGSGLVWKNEVGYEQDGCKRNVGERKNAINPEVKR